MGFSQQHGFLYTRKLEIRDPPMTKGRLGLVSSVNTRTISQVDCIRFCKAVPPMLYIPYIGLEDGVDPNTWVQRFLNYSSDRVARGVMVLKYSS